MLVFFPAGLVAIIISDLGEERLAIIRLVAKLHACVAELIRDEERRWDFLVQRVLNAKERRGFLFVYRLLYVAVLILFDSKKQRLGLFIALAVLC
jgi:hypothetical protein